MKNLANELRLGNKVLNYAGDQIDVTVEVITDIALNLRKCEPIPLTKEILESFGFKNRSSSSDFYFYKNDFIIGGEQRTLYPSIHSESGLEAYAEQCHFLHQLQNIYYFVTGQELIQ